MTKRLKKSLTILLTGSLLVGCTQVKIDDPQIRAHWIEENETAPFRGILLNDYTYYKLRQKIIDCESR